ncbi:MAG: Fic family protein [Elusimicrobia bacterium]|nr:Fic family protein [Elusimicrobiota bacterium]MBU2613982.1 Fic family protein [Elusimicrobiota bacterium]
MTFKPVYTITNHILRAVSRIDVLNEVIIKAELLPIWEKRLRHEARIKSTHYSTKIEGNRLTLEQVERLSKNQSVTGAPQRDIREVQNYFKVLDYVEEIGHKDIVYTEDMVLKMHYLTMNNILEGDLKGKYRTQQNVLRDYSTGIVVYMPPEHEQVPILMSELIKFLNDEKEMHPITKAGVVHYEFVRIHPFMDGNGRVARALCMLVLLASGYDVRKLFALEEYYESDRNRYYEAIESAQKNNDNTTGWLEYFTGGMVFELERVKGEIEQLQKGTKNGIPSDLSPRQISAVSFIRKLGSVTNSRYRKHFHVSNKTAQSDLQKLVDKEILKLEGRGRSVRYTIKH